MSDGNMFWGTETQTSTTLHMFWNVLVKVFAFICLLLQFV